MPNARPTQPGYYWAREVEADPTEPFMPVEVFKLFDEDDSPLRVWRFGCNDWGTLSMYEWGPAIPEYRGEGGG